MWSSVDDQARDVSERDSPSSPSASLLTTTDGLATVGRRRLTGPDYRRLGRGVYLPVGVTIDHGVRVRALRVRLGDRVVLVGISAAWALGCRLAGPEDRVHVMGRSGSRTSALGVVHRGDLPVSQLVGTPLGLATGPLATAVDLACGFGGTEAAELSERVAWLDAIVRYTSLTIAGLRRGVEESAGRRGITGARVVAAAVRDGVDSPRETALRLLVVAAGLPEPTVQCVVRDGRGAFVARLDLGWPEHRAGLEYDGAVHREFGQHSRDLARHNRIRAAGWRVIQVDARSLRRPAEFLRQVAGFLAEPTEPPRTT